MKNPMTWILKWPRIFWRAAKHFYNEDYTYQCSALAFITILAVVPVISILVYVFGKFTDFSHVLTLLNNYIYANFLPDSTQVLQKYLEQFTKQASRLPLISILFSFATGLILLLVIEQALNQIMRVHHKKRYFMTRMISLMILMLLPLYVGFTSFLGEFIYKSIGVSYLQYAMISALNLFINTSIFAIFYIVVPNRIIDWKDGLMGGFVTAILFEIIKKLFVWYIAYFTNYTAIYGALAVIPIFLTWLYISWAVFLYGALCVQVKMSIDQSEILS